MWNLFKVNNKDIKRRQWSHSSVFIVSFEHNSHLFCVSIAKLKQANVCWKIYFQHIHSIVRLEQYLEFAQIYQKGNQANVWNLFKVNNKDTMCEFFSKVKMKILE